MRLIDADALKESISEKNEAGIPATIICDVLDEAPTITDVEATEHCGLDYIMGQYFSMKKENEKLRENNRNLERTCKIEQQRLKETTERIEVMQKRTADEPDNVAHWIHTPPRIFSRCSGCGGRGYTDYNYCQWCGRKMQNEEVTP